MQARRAYLDLASAREQLQAASALVSARYNLLFQGTLLDYYYVGDLEVAPST